MMCYAAPATWRSFQMCLTVPMSMRTPIRCALLPIINASRHGVSHQRRAGAVAPLVYVGGQQLDDVFDTFKQCQLTPEPAIEISGASGVTLILALAAGTSWRGHAPGPDGLPGGYPVCLEKGKLVLDLPESITREEAIAWNASFETANGLVVEDGTVRYCGSSQACWKKKNFSMRKGLKLRNSNGSATIWPCCVTV